MRLRWWSLGFGLMMTVPALANPDGAPWGTVDPNASDNCNSCHFDSAARDNSSAVTLSGFPDHVLPKTTYDLTLSFESNQAVIAGFLLRASAGEFCCSDGAEAMEGRVRSILPLSAKDGFTWKIKWRSPKHEIESPIAINVAVNGANDDASPFGDHIHYRTFVLCPDEK